MEGETWFPRMAGIGGITHHPIFAIYTTYMPLNLLFFLVEIEILLEGESQIVKIGRVLKALFSSSSSSSSCCCCCCCFFCLHRSLNIQNHGPGHWNTGYLMHPKRAVWLCVRPGSSARGFCVRWKYQGVRGLREKISLQPVGRTPNWGDRKGK